MTPTPERIAEIRRLFDEKRDGKIVGDLLEWVDGLTRQRDAAEANMGRLDRLVEYEQDLRLKAIAKQVRLLLTQARVEELCTDWASSPGSIKAQCAEDIRAALAVTAPPETECDHGDSLYGRCTACGKTWEQQAAPPETPGEKLLRDIFTDPGKRALEKAAEGFHAFGKAAAWPPATPVEDPDKT